MKYNENYINIYRGYKTKINNLVTIFIKFEILFISNLVILYSLNIFVFKNKYIFNESNINKHYLEKSKIKGINYLNRCLSYLNKTKITSYKFNIFTKNPKITVIIPVYNSQKSIELSLTSILNQKMKDFEIILINDNSNDNSLKIINKMKKVDDRIKLINNHKNMGTLYSRCIGVLNAKGKYILNLDNDDLFLDSNIFVTIYNIAEHNKYDIVEFKSLTIPNYHPKFGDIKEFFFNYHPNNLILHQPELGIFPISRNNTYHINDFLIWAKCIKTKLYQISVNILGKKRYSIYICWNEDISMIFIIFLFIYAIINIKEMELFYLYLLVISKLEIF